MTTFADYLKDLRTSKRIGVRELGRECGVTGMHISNMEKSKSLPSPELIVKLARALEKVQVRVQLLLACRPPLMPGASRRT